MAKQWEVMKTLNYQNGAAQIEKNLNTGWKVVTSYFDGSDVVIVWKRKLKPSSPKMTLTFEEVTEDTGYDYQLASVLKIDPKARLFVSDEQFKIQWEGHNFTSRRFDWALESFQTFLATAKETFLKQGDE